MEGRKEGREGEEKGEKGGEGWREVVKEEEAEGGEREREREREKELNLRHQERPWALSPGMALQFAPELGSLSYLPTRR